MTQIVKTYGIFWERDKVDFGKKGPGNKGSLIGHCDEAKRTVTDFAQQRGIYILYEGPTINLQRVVYVGQTGGGGKRLLSRLRDHTTDHLWNRWNRFSWLGFLGVNKEFSGLVHKDKAAIAAVPFSTALDQLEATLIDFMEPLMNKQGAQWHGALQYFQGRPE
jgi:hypothetical protein